MNVGNFWTFSFVPKPLPSLFLHIANIATPWKPWGGNDPKEFTALSPYWDYKALQNTQNSWKEIVEPVGCSQVEAMLQAFHISFKHGHSEQVQTLRLVLDRFPVELGCTHPPTDQVRCSWVPSLQTLAQSNLLSAESKNYGLLHKSGANQLKRGMKRNETRQRVAQVFLVWEDKHESVVTHFWFQRDWKLWNVILCFAFWSIEATFCWTVWLSFSSAIGWWCLCDCWISVQHVLEEAITFRFWVTTKPGIYYSYCNSVLQILQCLCNFRSFQIFLPALWMSFCHLFLVIYQLISWKV